MWTIATDQLPSHGVHPAEAERDCIICWTYSTLPMLVGLDVSSVHFSHQLGVAIASVISLNHIIATASRLAGGDPPEVTNRLTETMISNSCLDMAGKEK